MEARTALAGGTVESAARPGPADPRLARRGRGCRVARIGDGGDLLKCSFCGKSQKQVKKLIAGPGVYICDECIDLCNEIIEEELAESSRAQVGRAAQADGDLRVPRRSTSSARTSAKKALAVAVYNHYKRVQAGEPASAARDDHVELAKSNILLHRPDRLRQDATSRRPWPGCSTSRSPSPTPPR